MCQYLSYLLFFSFASLYGNLVSSSPSNFDHRAYFLMIFLAALAASRFGGLLSFSILTHEWHLAIPCYRLSSL